METAGAQRGFLVLRGERCGHGQRRVLAFAERDAEGAITVASRAGPVDAHEDLARSVLRHVEQTRQAVSLEHAAADGAFRSDPYVVHARPRSVLCLPLLSRDGAPRRALPGEQPGRRRLHPRAPRRAGDPRRPGRHLPRERPRPRGARPAGARPGARSRRGAAPTSPTRSSRSRTRSKRLLVQEKLASLGGAHRRHRPRDQEPAQLHQQLRRALGGHRRRALRGAARPGRRARPDARRRTWTSSSASCAATPPRSTSTAGAPTTSSRAMLEHSRGARAPRRAPSTSTRCSRST